MAVGAEIALNLDVRGLVGAEGIMNALFLCAFFLPRLLFLENGTHVCATVVTIEDINSVEAITYSESLLSRGITAIKITSKCK